MVWRNNPEIVDFLQNLDNLTISYNFIEARTGAVRLCHNFWSINEIEDGEGIKDEWDLDDSMVPFYGDWHDLFCIDMKTLPVSIVYMDDSRNVIYRWYNIDQFITSLRKVEEKDDDDLQGVKIQLDF